MAELIHTDDTVLHSFATKPAHKNWKKKYHCSAKGRASVIFMKDSYKQRQKDKLSNSPNYCFLITVFYLKDFVWQSQVSSYFLKIYFNKMKYPNETKGNFEKGN